MAPRTRADEIGDGGDSKAAKRRRVEVHGAAGCSVQVAGGSAGGGSASAAAGGLKSRIKIPKNTEPLAAQGSHFVADMWPEVLGGASRVSRRRSTGPAFDSDGKTEPFGHRTLEWVGLCRSRGSALNSANDGAEEMKVLELDTVDDGQQIGCINFAINWRLEDGNLSMIDGNEGDASQVAEKDLFNQTRRMLGADREIQYSPLISFRDEYSRNQSRREVIKLPVLVCRLANNQGDPQTLFTKPLTHPDVHVSTTGRYDQNLPMSVLADDVSISMGNGKVHWPAPTLLHAVHSLAKECESLLFTKDATLTACYSASDDFIKLHLRFPLFLPNHVLAEMALAHESRAQAFWPAIHDLLNHLHPAASALKKSGKSVAREFRLNDLAGEVRDLYTAILPDKDPEGIFAAEFCEPAELECDLLPFQKRTVQWMLAREGVVSTEHGLEPWAPDGNETFRIHSGGFWEKVQVSESRDGVLWIERMTGAIKRDCEMGVEDRSDGGYGVLAEEMGLGKTVELLSLVLAHKPGLHSSPALQPPTCFCGKNSDSSSSQRSMVKCSRCDRSYHSRCVKGDQSDSDEDEFICVDCKGKGKKRIASADSMDTLGDGLPFVPATLIVTPLAILSQWAEEIRQHSPTTKVVVYSGIKTGIEAASDVVDCMESKKRGDEGEDDVDLFADADIVLTTYEVLQKEIWHARKDPARARRFERRYERKMSPLVGKRWWRVCLDEAQRVESGVSGAAAMVGLIPRIHAWVVTGTPIGKAGINDLQGLFLFLKQPRILAESMFFRCACLPIPSYRNTLLAALSDIMHRNTKDHVKEDLSIPAQEEHIFPVSLNEVEREYYSQQSESCQDDLHAVLGANPSAQLPELDALKLRKWLLRLRQTCVHPQIGQENQRTLGTKPIQGINDLLHWMARECASELLSAERQLLATRIRRAQALEQRASFQDALDLYQQLLSDVEKSVAEARVEVVTNRDSLGVVAGRVDAAGNSDACEATDQDRQEKIVGATARLNSWLQVEHRLVFFIALIHEKLKDKALEKHLFDRAEGIRRELLGPWIQDVESETMKIKESIGNGTLNLQIPMSAFDGGLTVQELCLQSQATLAALNKQGANLVAWRKKILDVLMADLDRAKPAENANDQDNAVAGNHTSVEVIDEDAQYQISLLVQEEVNSYQDVYKESLLDRITLLIGAARPPESEEHAKKSAILTQLAKERIIPTNLRDLKALVSGFRVHGQARAGVPELELQLCQNESRRLNKELERAMKMLDSLKRENLLINRLQNARIVYYHALQEISDSVEAAKFTDAEKANNYASAIQSCLDEEKKLRSKIDLLDGKRRYLKTLGNETRRVEPRICAICGDRYDRAAVTPCGHFFCISCLTKSVELHHRCPGCNASLSVDEITAVSFTDTKDQQAMAQTLPFKPVSSFCTMADDALTAKVSKVQIKGSFGSKLDTILKHILSLDPTEKVALFSQWDQVLDLLAKGLSLNGIKYVRFRGAQRNTAAIRFRRDPEIRVFILDARSQSAGLTLVSATHVMLVEPILHPGIELQAINRVHRIGQARRTHVWRYIVGGTIEEGLFELYETRRRAISGRSEEFDGETAEDLENARMLPLANRAAGEVVGNGDIIRLLKGALGRRAEKEEVDIDMEESTD